MKFVFVPTLFLLLVARVSAADKSDQVDSQAAGRFAKLALTCLHQEYPNRIGHTLNSDADVAPPRKLTPAFYGCYAGIVRCMDTGCWCGSSEPFRMVTSSSLRAQPCARA